MGKNLPLPLPLSVRAVTDGGGRFSPQSGQAWVILHGSRTSSCFPFSTTRDLRQEAVAFGKGVFCSVAAETGARGPLVHPECWLVPQGRQLLDIDLHRPGHAGYVVRGGVQGVGPLDHRTIPDRTEIAGHSLRVTSCGSLRREKTKSPLVLVKSVNATPRDATQTTPDPLSVPASLPARQPAS